MIGGRVHFPVGYNLKKVTDDFIWIADEKQYSTQGVFIYKYPATDEDPFSEENIIARRNVFLKEYVPATAENSYMTTSVFVKPGIKFLKYHNLDSWRPEVFGRSITTTWAARSSHIRSTARTERTSSCWRHGSMLRSMTNDSILGRQSLFCTRLSGMRTEMMANRANIVRIIL